MAAAYSLAWDVSLRDRNTFHLDARAHCLATVHDATALPSLLAEPGVAEPAADGAGRRQQRALRHRPVRRLPDSPAVRFGPHRGRRRRARARARRCRVRMGCARRLDARSRPAGPREPRVDSRSGGRCTDPEHRRLRRRGRQVHRGRARLRPPGGCRRPAGGRALRVRLSRQRVQARARSPDRHGDRAAAAEDRRDEPRVCRARARNSPRWAG